MQVQLTKSLTDTASPTSSGAYPWELADERIHDFVDSMVRLTIPDRIYWCNGSEYERQRLAGDAILQESLAYPYPRPAFGADEQEIGWRLSSLPFRHAVCTMHPDPAYSADSWMQSTAASDALRKLFNGSMRGRTLYVLPMLASSHEHEPTMAVLITDSIDLVLRKLHDTQVGNTVLRQGDPSTVLPRFVHSMGDPRVPHQRHICHFPAEHSSWSFGLGSAENAADCAECAALGWLEE